MDSWKETPAELQAEIREMLEDLAKAQAALDAARKETGIDSLEEKIATIKKNIGAAVLSLGEPVKGERYQAIINKGRTTWDGSKLEGMAAIIPQINEARKVCEPTVTIKAVK